MTWTRCACGHGETAHLTEVELAVAGGPPNPLRPCMVSDVAGRICPCITWRPRTPAPWRVRATNAILGRVLR